jgi:hypothetical protein
MCTGHICTVPYTLLIYSTGTENYSKLDPYIKCQFASLSVYLSWLYNGEHACIISCLSSCQKFASFTQPWANASKTGTARVFSCHVMQINSTHSATPLSPLLLYGNKYNVTAHKVCHRFVLLRFFYVFCRIHATRAHFSCSWIIFWQKVEEAEMCIILFLWSRVVFVCDPHGRPLIKEHLKMKAPTNRGYFVFVP